MALAFTTLVVISYYFGDFNRELSIAITVIVVAGFAIPYMVYHSFDEQSISQLASSPSEFEEEQAEMAVDHDFWELKDRVEPWLYAFVTFVVFGISRMLSENAFVLSLGKQDEGRQLVRAFRSAELVGVCLTGLVLIFFRQFIQPSVLMIIQVFILVAAQLSMLNPDRESLSIETLLLLTTVLSALAEGGYLVTLCCYLHEQYG